MPIIYIEKTTEKKEDSVVKKSYYHDQKRISARKFWAALNKTRKQQMEDIFAIYEGV